MQCRHHSGHVEHDFSAVSGVIASGWTSDVRSQTALEADVLLQVNFPAKIVDEVVVLQRAVLRLLHEQVTIRLLAALPVQDTNGVALAFNIHVELLEGVAEVFVDLDATESVANIDL